MTKTKNKNADRARGRYISGPRVWVRCLGPAAKKNPDHGFYAPAGSRKYGMCERCLDKITLMSRMDLEDRVDSKEGE